MPLAVIVGSRNISEIFWTIYKTQKCCSTEELGHTYSAGQKEVAFRLTINDEDLCKIVKLLTGLVQKHALSCLMVGFFFFSLVFAPFQQNPTLLAPRLISPAF